MTGYVLYTEKNEPETVRSHPFDRIVSLADGVLILQTDQGPRSHTMNDYIDFGIFPIGPEHQTVESGSMLF